MCGRRGRTGGARLLLPGPGLVPHRRHCGVRLRPAHCAVQEPCCQPCDPAGGVRSGAGWQCRHLCYHLRVRVHGGPRRRCWLQHVILSRSNKIAIWLSNLSFKTNQYRINLKIRSIRRTIVKETK